MVVRLASRENRTGIRPLDPVRDLGQLANLIENAFGDELSEGGAQVLREIRLLSWLGPLNYLLDGMSSEIDGMFTGFVWEQEGVVVGNVSVNRPTGHPHRWQISNVSVLDSFQRLGIGHRLMEAAIDFVLSRGGHIAYLFVRDDNLPALHLYRTLGFTEVDRSTDLKFVPSRVRVGAPQVRVLQPLKHALGDAVYELVQRAEGAGRRWLYAIRRGQYVRSWDECLGRWLESLFSEERESRWGVVDRSGLHAAVILRATRLWNLKPHRLQLWVHPDWRGYKEDAIAQDIVSILQWQAARTTYISLPDCEEHAIDALLNHGFLKIRTLALMKLEL